MRSCVWTGALIACACLGTDTDAQTYYKCRDAAGQLQFSDRLCAGAVAGVISPKPGNADSAERKSENDARVAREKDLANQMEARRVAEEQAAHAAQAQQAQRDKALSDQRDQERTRQSASVTSGSAGTNAPTVPAFSDRPAAPVLTGAPTAPTVRQY